MRQTCVAVHAAIEQPKNADEHFFTVPLGDWGSVCARSTFNRRSGLPSMRTPRHDLTGKRFGRLVVINLGGWTPAGNSIWTCLCDCGKTKNVRGYVLLRAETSSCGCLRRECFDRGMNFQHGHCPRSGCSPEFSSWTSMKARCLNPNDPFYSHYGGRGIRICQEWLDSFEVFLADMGPTAKGHLD